MFAFHSVQPVMFHHSSRGLGHDPQQVLVFVYTNALLAKFVFEKIVIAFSWKMNLHFWLAIHRKQCLWLSTLSDAACWENPNPPWAQNICGYAFKERFLTRPKILKTPGSKKSQVFFVQWEGVLPFAENSISDHRTLCGARFYANLRKLLVRFWNHSYTEFIIYLQE